ncbi:uncharacterized protein LOC116265436 [Nymphaea colorata]|nr:uncharacterized protein LOC116265436 [Nymphaea colorata]
MGGAMRKNLKCEQREGAAELKQEIQRLQAEVERLRNEREEDQSARRKELAAKQAEWSREKKRLEEEVSALASSRGRRCWGGEEGVQMLEMKESEWSHILAEQMKEQKQREEAVEKWKRLYLAIKNELDQLIQATALLSNPYQQGEENFCIEWLRGELKAKEEANAELKAKVAEVEKESARREREMDILRQSLRIMTTRCSSNRQFM